MSSETGVAWFDALPGLTPHDSPSEDPARLFWPSQIARAREANQAGHAASRHALARTLLAGYNDRLCSEWLSESLSLLRDLHGRASRDNLVQATLDLGEALLADHVRTGMIEPIQEMVRIHEQSFSDGQLYPDGRCQLAKALISRGRFTGYNADVSRARAILDTISMPLEHPSRADFAVVLAMHHVTLFEASRVYVLEDLRSLTDELVGHLNHKSYWDQERRSDLLAACFSVSAIICNMTYSDAYVSGAVEIADDVLAILSHQPFAVASALSEFCMTLATFRKDDSRFGYMQKSRQLIDRMFHTARCNRINTGQAHYALTRWMNYSYRWCQDDYTNSLELAAVRVSQALILCPAGHIHRNAYLVALSYSLLRQFHQTGTRSVLQQVIALSESYADILQRVPPFASNVSLAMAWRAQAGHLRLESKRDLTQRATRILQDALLLTPPYTTFGSAMINHLIHIHLMESSWGGSESTDGDECLALARRSVAADSDHSTTSLSQAERNLAEILLYRAQAKEDLAALGESITLLERISTRIDIADHTVPVEATWLLANCYMVRYKLLGIEEDRRTAEEAVQTSLRNCLSLSGRYPLERLRDWANAAHYAGQHATELRAYREIIKTLPQLACLGEDVSTRVEALQAAEGLACPAAMLSITHGDVLGAVELLEQSRGVVWTQTLRSRTLISSVPPDYADHFARITRALKETSDGSLDAAVKLRDSATQLDSLLDRIRQVEGYERFLLPRLYTELRTCTAHGFVALVIPSETCTDVLIMRSEVETPGHLRLHSVRLQRLQDWTAKLKRSCDQSRASMSAERLGVKISAPPMPPPREQAYLKVLGELWREIVQPVLANLGVERSQDDPGSRPRLWWCPAGPFAELPLHAAGIYRGNSQDCLSDYVVSSYTPTLSALINAQSVSSKDGVESNVLVVAAPHNSEGLPSLPNTRAEADRIRDVIPSASLTTLSGLQASIENVLKALPDISVLHLACHGQQSQNDTLASGFSLRDGRLTLKRLMQLHLPNAELAYLSACETASTDEYQPDEAMNLAATMLFVGFKSVVATMWSMDDLDGPFIAERVYRTIFRDGKLNLSAVPHALDAAVRDLRETGAHPSRWATYVHIGA